jgi:hypothetical protein
MTHGGARRWSAASASRRCHLQRCENSHRGQSGLLLAIGETLEQRICAIFWSGRSPVVKSRGGVGRCRRGKVGEKCGSQPARPLRPANIAVAAGLQVPAKHLQVGWPMRGLLWSKKWPRPANRARRRDTGRFAGSARVALSISTNLRYF